MEECQTRLSPKVSLDEIRSSVSGNMLCFDTISEHFFNRSQDLSPLFNNIAETAVNKLVEDMFPGSADTSFSLIPPTG